MTKLIIVRHGESIGNAKFLALGHTDMDLTELGYRQANATAKFLADWQIDAVYSSDLSRAVNTAMPHAEIRGLEVHKSANLREVFLGDWENMRVQDVIDAYGTVYTVDWREKFGTFTVPGGESVMGAADRFYNEIVRISEENEGKTVLVAAHAAIIRAFWGKISGILPENLAQEVEFPSNASYSLATYENGELIPGEYSCDAHLSEVGITKIAGNRW